MLLLIVGLLIWIAAHLLRSCAKDLRAAMQQKLGLGSKIVIALIISAGLALMIIGYKSVGAGSTLLWMPPAWMTYINNVLMFGALYIYFTTATKPGTAFVFGAVKNPQLIGFKIWAVAHLLVNGDLRSVVLFGGLLVWAVLQVILANKNESLVNRSLAPISSPIVHLVLVVVIFLLIMLVHNWLGVRPVA